MNSKNKETLSLLGFDPDLSGSVGAVGNPTAYTPLVGLKRRSWKQRLPIWSVSLILRSTISIIRPNQVWATDITYIRLTGGFVYLVAVMDWFSRYVLAWELSNSLDVYFCLSALDKALSQSTPLIFNTDQGSQFTADAFTARLQAANIAISWDSRGSYFDNIFIERLWRSVKYEEVYLNDYDSVTTARCRLRDYFNFYNQQRFHQSLNYRTPHEVYFQ